MDIISLLPVSEAPKVAPVAKKFPSYNPHFKTDEEKKEEVTGYSMFLYTSICLKGRETAQLMSEGTVYIVIF